MSGLARRILIVDDEQDVCELLSALVKREGFEALWATDGEAALRLVLSESPDVVVMDFVMPGMDGMEVLRRVRKLAKEVPVIMISGYGGIKGAVEAIKAGAQDYLSKPLEHQEVLRVIRRVLAERAFKAEPRPQGNQLHHAGLLREMMGPSEVVSRLAAEVDRVAKSDLAVVIVGETGSGKEIVAGAIHAGSARSGAPCVPVDCGAIQETLFESELFGHEKGAFTSAVGSKPGRLELARGGTLFLDEISNMPLGCQAKLLRVIQERVAYRVGASTPRDVDARLLAATNRDLHELTLSGSFRADLFYRLTEFTIEVPPLRERKDDIPYLAKRFLDSASSEWDKSVKGFSESALEALMAYDWPGNVRELRSIVRSAALLTDDVISETHLRFKTLSLPGLDRAAAVRLTQGSGLSLRQIVRQCVAAVEREVIEEVLRRAGGNKAKAARLLRVDYKTIHTKVKRLGIGIHGG